MARARSRSRSREEPEICFLPRCCNPRRQDLQKLYSCLMIRCQLPCTSLRMQHRTAFMQQFHLAECAADRCLQLRLGTRPQPPNSLRVKSIYLTVSHSDFGIVLRYCGASVFHRNVEDGRAPLRRKPQTVPPRVLSRSANGHTRSMEGLDRVRQSDRVAQAPTLQHEHELHWWMWIWDA